MSGSEGAARWLAALALCVIAAANPPGVGGSLLAGVTPAAAPGPAPKAVLILSEGPVLPYAAVLREQLVAALRRDSAEPLNIYEESIDRVRFDSADYDRQLVALYKAKYVDTTPPTLIITITEPALDFALRHRADLFPHAALLFGAVDERVVQGRDLGANATGVYSHYQARATVEAALALQPGTRQIVVVGGTSRLDRGYADVARKDLQGLAAPAAVSYLTGQPLNEVLTSVAALGDGAVVLFLSMQLDGQGVARTGPEVLATLRGAAKVPIYGMSGNFIGRGIVGGMLFDVQSHGADLAQRAPADPLRRSGRRPRADAVAEHADLRLARAEALRHRCRTAAGGRHCDQPPARSVGRAPTNHSDRQRRRDRSVPVDWRSAGSARPAPPRRARAPRSERTADRGAGGGTPPDCPGAARQRQPADCAARDPDRPDGGRSGAVPGDGGRSMRELRNRTVEISTEIHTLSRRLHSAKLEVLGLVEALRGHCHELRAQGVHASFHDEAFRHRCRSDVSLCLFRIAQEGLNNVVKHSGAREAHVTLRSTGSFLLLAVADAGHGFHEAEAPGGGLGLASMRERLRLIDGELTVRSQPGQGTTITARVPMAQRGVQP